MRDFTGREDEVLKVGNVNASREQIDRHDNSRIWSIAKLSVPAAVGQLVL